MESALAGDGQYSASIPLEGLVKMDHIQKEPTAKLEKEHEAPEGRNVRFAPESGHVRRNEGMSAFGTDSESFA